MINKKIIIFTIISLLVIGCTTTAKKERKITNSSQISTPSSSGKYIKEFSKIFELSLNKQRDRKKNDARINQLISNVRYDYLVKRSAKVEKVASYIFSKLKNNLKYLIQKKFDPQNYQKLLLFLGNIKYKPTENYLVEIIRDERVYISTRSTAIEALGRFKNEQHINFIAKFILNEHYNIVYASSNVCYIMLARTCNKNLKTKIQLIHNSKVDKKLRKLQTQYLSRILAYLSK